MLSKAYMSLDHELVMLLQLDGLRKWYRYHSSIVRVGPRWNRRLWRGHKSDTMYIILVHWSRWIIVVHPGYSLFTDILTISKFTFTNHMAADMTSLDSFDRDNKYKTTPSSKKIECQTSCQFKYYFVIQ